MVGLRESNESEHDDSSADAPVVAPTSSNGSLHREDAFEADNPALCEMVQRDEGTNEPTDGELTAAWAAIEIEERASDYGWADDVEGPQEENTMSPRELPRCASKTSLGERSEPDWTAYRNAMNEAWDQVKAAGRLDEPGLWDRIRGEIGRGFGVDE